MPEPNHAGVHLEVSRALPLNSSLKTRRQFPVWPTGMVPEDVAVGELVGVAVLVPVGRGVADLVLVGSGLVAAGVGVLLHQRRLSSTMMLLFETTGL